MDYYSYVQALDVVQREFRQIEDMYKAYPDNQILGNQAHNTLRSLYKKTTEILDLKKSELGSISNVEQQLYDRCKKELDSEERLRGGIRLVARILSCLIDAYESIYHLLPSGKEEGKIQKLLLNSGEILLPGYIGFLTTLVDTYETFLMPDILLTPATMYDAASIAAKQYQLKNVDPNHNILKDILGFADQAYTGNQEFSGFVALKKEEFIDSLSSFYNESTGIFSSGHGLRVWLAKKEDTYVVAFSGTDPLNIIMDFEDFNQIFTGSPLYLEAAGFLRMFLEKYANNKIIVCGHSLGGGLAQFSVVSNINSFRGNVSCYGFNPAGLSCHSLNCLKEERLNKAKSSIFVYVTQKDIVSMSGAKLGTVTMLPKTTSNGHGMKSLYQCLDAYLNKSIPTSSLKTVPFNFYSTNSDTLPGWKTPMCASKDNSVLYNIFSTNTTGKVFYMTANIDKSVINKIEANDSDNCCFGIYENFNGDGFTVCNRLTILDVNSSIQFTRESAASTVFFGAFGYGTAQWLLRISEALQDKLNMDACIGALSKEYELMLSAWLYILKYIYGKDFYYYFENQIAKKNALRMIIDYSEQSKSLFKRYDYQRKLLKNEYTEYITKKSEIFKNFLDTGFHEAVNYSLLTLNEAQAIENNIMKYLNYFIQKWIQEEYQ